jgi:hypothetical protein
MTKEEFAKQMEKIAEDLDNDVYDEEGAHVRADDLMIKCLYSLGYTEGVDTFIQMPKWYA